MYTNDTVKQIKVGSTLIGGGAPITIQSMLCAPASDIEGNVAQAKRLEEAGCEIVRVSVPDKNAVKLISALKENINIPVVHCQKGIGELISQGGNDNYNLAIERFEIDCNIAKSLGAKKLVLHLWGGLPSDSCFENNISAYSDLIKIANRYSLKLLIENIVCNNKDPMSRWNELLSVYPDVEFIFDTKMAQFHNQINELYNPENAYITSRINHYHVNDYAGGYMDWANLKTLPIGKGNVDFNAFFNHLKNIGYNDTLTIESTAFNTDGVVDIEMLNTQFEILKSQFN